MPPSAAATTPAASVVGVEPDAVTRELIALYLEPLGYAVHLKPTVAEALAALDGQRTALFVCSERAVEEALPAERSALEQALAALPVLVLLEPGAEAECTRAWPFVRGRLTKPVAGEALLTLVQSTGKRARGVAPPSSVQPHEPVDGPEPTPSGALHGFERLVREMAMEPSLARDLVTSFLDRMPVYIEDVGVGMARGDLAAVERSAHTIKGMCGNLRFQHLVVLSDGLRRAAHAGDALGVERYLARLRGETEALGADLRARWMRT